MDRPAGQEVESHFTSGEEPGHVDLERALEEAVIEDAERRGASCAACGCLDLEAEAWNVGDGLNGEEARAAVVCVDCGARLNVRVTGELLEEAREKAR